LKAHAGHDQSFVMKLSQSSVDRALSAFADLDLGDPRRRERVLRTVGNLASNPRASFPEAMGSEADVEGAYRLMNSSRVEMADLNGAHARVAAKRARAAGRVLAIHDTTSFEFGHADPREIGYLNTGKPGFLVHYALLVALEDLRPLGIGSVEVISREKPPSKRSPKGALSRKRSAAETVKDPERESLRWFRGFDAVDQLLEGTDVVHVADREGDNYELFAHAIADGQRFVVRARVLDRKVENSDGDVDVLRTVVEGARGALKREVPLSARKHKGLQLSAHLDRAARLAKLEFSGTRVVVRRPRYQDKALLEEIELNIVRVLEPNPPAGAEPIEWVLYTTESISTAEDIAAIVDIYRARWLIEECNKAIKTGCRYEDRQFESLDALLTLLAMTFPIAVELLWIRAACRKSPNRPAAEVLTRVQLEVLRRMASRKLPPNATVHDALWSIAGMGGHMKTNGEPGWLVLHRGMTKLLAYEEGWLARENADGLSISR
jgi:Transposase DNA-binding/Transposase DDE domain